ncbi:NAD/NADP octopine/nopaline dehydrogenase family protein [Martelella lutilitoris]|uniref:NAD/NADP octopine/nopaline dehydrogenase family protein n=1 Tax=Martelella lutilitoris TaxID=2583532 RepID=A0A7T7HKL1_9HYPH|nr:NAD/NADP-dependent octopine/nopaline dehydrogenase family protein [Martelella lutilitoris]QQM30909.1 NAD/NADP octopine/nopaline dehydrogenase family protein [Martelella lutilitoris]
MKIAILGAGNNAYGLAAFIADAGHAPVLWSPSGSNAVELARGTALMATGAVEFEGPVGVAASCADAVGNADLVMIAMPVNGHRSAIDAMTDHLKPGTPVIISSHSSFAALYLARALKEAGKTLPIIAWGTTLLTARKNGDSAVVVNTVRQKVDMATVPFNAMDEGHALCTELFGDRFVRRDGLMAIALSNLNPQNHLGIALMNLTRMEKGETWGQGENITPAVGRFIEALDAERLAIAEKFGLQVKTVREHFSLSFHVPLASVSEMNQEMHAQGRGGFGPSTIESRYILEDVPFGLVATSALGRLVGVPATLHEAGTAIFSAAYGHDLAADNDLLPALGFASLDRQELERLCRDGYAG